MIMSRFDQSKNVQCYAMPGFVMHYNHIQWKLVNKTTWIVSATLVSTILSFR